jgi:hypothetical protein
MCALERECFQYPVYVPVNGQIVDLGSKMLNVKKGKSEGAGKELGGGGGGLRGVVWCDDDNRIVVTCSCMPSQGDKRKFLVCVK